MAQTTRTLPFAILLAVVAALIIAGAVTFGVAQTITLFAIFAMVVIFYLMIHISAN